MPSQRAIDKDHQHIQAHHGSSISHKTNQSALHLRDSSLHTVFEGLMTKELLVTEYHFLGPI